MPRWPVSFDLRVDVSHREVVSLVAQAHALATVIRDIPIPPGIRQRIDALNILRAVRGTTGIEGAELSEEEVRQIMESPGKVVLPPNRQREEQEARNAQRLMYYVAEEVSRNPALVLTEDLVCKLHEITTQDIDYANNVPGKYRSHPVQAGSYIPPQTGEEVRGLMREFIAWFNEGPPATWDPVVRALVAHFYTVSIHPFGDGNGRTSRGVESLLLYQSGVNVRGFYSLANYYYRHRPEYVQHLDHVRFQSGGDLTPLVLFALRGLVAELKAVHSEIIDEVKWVSFRDFARETLALYGKLGTQAGERMFHFLLGLGREPVSLKALRRGNHALSRLYRKVTSKTLSRDINFFSEAKLITVDGDSVRANLEIMKTYTPPDELVRRPSVQDQAIRARIQALRARGSRRSAP